MVIGIVSLVLGVALAAEPDETLQARASSHFEPAEPTEAVQARLDAAIERTLMSMTWLFRPIARPRMKKNILWCTAWTTALDGEAFTVQCAGEAEPFVVPFSCAGLTVPDDEGDPMVVSLELGEETVKLCRASDEATHCNHFHYLADGVLEVKTTIESPHFGVPIAHQVRYRATP